MSTRSIIAQPCADGSYEGIYCHFDGHPQGVGLTLKEHYLYPEKVNELILGGDISSLGNTIEETVFYTQRKEKYHRYQEVRNILAFKAIAKNAGCDYLYVYVPESKDWDCHMIDW